jgi:acetyltransferase-like isoleucine patch superfamily enzyme
MLDKSRIPIARMLTEGALPTTLRRPLYRRKGYRIGADVSFAPGVVIDADDVVIEDGASIGLGCVIRGRSVHIGRRAKIGAFCFFEGRDMSIGSDTVIREQVFVGGPLLPDSKLEIGKRVRVFQTCFLNPSRPLSIGDDTGVGGRSSIFTHGSWQSALEGYPVAFEPVTIRRNVWLPWHVFILPGVELGDNVTIGAGSVVNRSIPAGALAAGVPAKVLKPSNEWPRAIDRDAQWHLAQSIFSEMLAYMKDNGVNVSVSTNSGRSDATLFYDGSQRRISLVGSGAAADGADDIVIELDEPGEPQPRAATTWLGLLSKARAGRRDDVSAEVEAFIARYGIRFAGDDY